MEYFWTMFIAWAITGAAVADDKDGSAGLVVSFAIIVSIGGVALCYVSILPVIVCIPLAFVGGICAYSSQQNHCFHNGLEMI